MIRVSRNESMRLASLLLGMFAVVAACGRSTAADPAAKSHWWDHLCRSCPHCPDDYCPKPLPAGPGAACLGRDDYCRQPLPGVYPVTCLGKNDYCSKPLPCLPACWLPPWFSCGCRR